MNKRPLGCPWWIWIIPGGAFGWFLAGALFKEDD